MIQDILILSHYKTLVAYDGTTALKLVAQMPVDLAILDLRLPDIYGMDLMQQIHEVRPTLPCLFLTGSDTEAEIVKGLELGAEDYITKPFRPRELLTRMKKVLSRQTEGQQLPTVLKQKKKSGRSVKGLALDAKERTVQLLEEPVELTRIEFDLLYLLMKNEKMVLTRRQILDHLWPDDPDVSNRVVDTHIKHLRHKLRDDPRKPTFIKTIRGVGYSFRP